MIRDIIANFGIVATLMILTHSIDSILPSLFYFNQTTGTKSGVKTTATFCSKLISKVE
jgi:hypothetical protein